MGRLSIELVPETAFWKNVRSHVTKAQWEVCKTYAKWKTDAENPYCIVCGQTGFHQGRRHAVEAHEIWHYNDEEGIQTLVDIVPLCPRCHQCKHLGRTRAVSTPEQWARVIEHFQKVNDWGDDRTMKYIETVFEIWRLRSQVAWELDISWLKNLGIQVS